MFLSRNSSTTPINLLKFENDNKYLVLNVFIFCLYRITNKHKSSLYHSPPPDDAAAISCNCLTNLFRCANV